MRGLLEGDKSERERSRAEELSAMPPSSSTYFVTFWSCDIEQISESLLDVHFSL